jgi:uncharacterized circularly permuted ATP-grasp superfamily protein
VLGRLDRLVLKPVAGSGGYGILIGPQASDEDLAEARRNVEADPRAWIAQELVPLSTAPTRAGDVLAPRHLDLRPFAVNDGKKIWVVPGGLTRVALPAGGMVVNSSQGGGSKDTWVTVGDRRPTPPRARRVLSASVVRPTGVRPDPGPQLDQSSEQQQQQQQQQGTDMTGTSAAC